MTHQPRSNKDLSLSVVALYGSYEKTVCEVKTFYKEKEQK